VAAGSSFLMSAAGADWSIQFGISVVPATERLDRVRELVRAADEAALDLVGVQDHPYQRHFLDTWWADTDAARRDGARFVVLRRVLGPR
jgi:hypothetical protein